MPAKPGSFLHRTPTPEEFRAAKRLHADLDADRLSVVLVPAPRQSFEGHKVRAVERRNPPWYRKFFGARRCGVKRGRVIRALERVLMGRVRANGYEVDLLSELFVIER